MRRSARDDPARGEAIADRLGEEELGDLDFLARWQRAQGISLSHCSQVVEAVAADAAVARLLGLKARSPVLKESDVMHVSSGRPAGVFVSYYRPDCFQFTATVRITVKHTSVGGRSIYPERNS